MDKLLPEDVLTVGDVQLCAHVRTALSFLATAPEDAAERIKALETVFEAARRFSEIFTRANPMPGGDIEFKQLYEITDKTITECFGSPDHSSGFYYLDSGNLQALIMRVFKKTNRLKQGDTQETITRGSGCLFCDLEINHQDGIECTLGEK